MNVNTVLYVGYIGEINMKFADMLEPLESGRRVRNHTFWNNKYWILDKSSNPHVLRWDTGNPIKSVAHHLMFERGWTVLPEEPIFSLTFDNALVALLSGATIQCENWSRTLNMRLLNNTTCDSGGAQLPPTVLLENKNKKWRVTNDTDVVVE